MHSSIDLLLSRIKAGLPVDFNDTQQVIKQYYQYHPVCFTNGPESDQLINEAGTNEGSCRIFYFARLHGLNESETLHLFGAFYREDVMVHPEGQNHPNIRQFMKYGWGGIHYQEGSHPCLVLRTNPLVAEA